MMKSGSIMKCVLVAVLGFGVALPASAWFTQPVADDANTDAGLMRISGGITLESDVNLYGARFTYGVADDFAVFGGGGLVDPDGMDSEPFFQVGGQYKLPVADIPFDLALRGAFGISSWEDSARFNGAQVKSELDIWFLNFGALGSKELDMVTVYGFAGLSYRKVDVDFTVTAPGFRERESDSDSDTELAIGGGVIFPLDDNISFYGELMHIDELFISLGARYQF